MLRWIGVLLVLVSAGSFGIGKALQFYRAVHQLREFRSAVEIIKCELNYTLRPLPRLCKSAADRLCGQVAQYFRRYAALLECGQPCAKAASAAMEETKGLCIPNDAVMAVLELCSALGQYDLEGENRILQLCGHRIASALERCEAEKKPLAKSYAALGICSGIALVILMI